MRAGAGHAKQQNARRPAGAQGAADARAARRKTHFFENAEKAAALPRGKKRRGQPERAAKADGKRQPRRGAGAASLGTGGRTQHKIQVE